MELPDPVRQRLGNFSRTVFSDSNRTGPEYSEGPGEWPRPGAAGMACGGPGVGLRSGQSLPGPKMAASPSAGFSAVRKESRRRGPPLGWGWGWGWDTSSPVSLTVLAGEL